MNQQPEVDLTQSVTATEAAKLLEVSPRKLAELIASGDIPTHPDPRHKQMKRILLSDIEAWKKRAGPPIKRQRHPKPQEPERSCAA